MVFKKKGTAAAAVDTDTSAATGNASVINLTERLKQVEIELMGAGITGENVPLPDLSMDEDIREAFKGLTAKLGFNDYNPEGSTCLFLTGDNPRLATPAVYAYEDGLCIRWGDQRFVIPEDVTFPSDSYALNLGDDTIILDPAGYALVCPVRLQYQHRSEEGRKLISAKLSMANTPEKLSPYLLRGEQRLSWGEVEDGASIQFFHIQWNEKRDKEGEFWGSLLGSVNDEPALFYAPGSKEDWSQFGTDVDGWFTDELTVSKEDKKLTVNGNEYELTGGNYMKLAELTPEQSYVVNGYKKTDGKFGEGIEIYVVVDGSEKTINGNTYLKKLLLGSTIEVTSDNPATLHVDRIEAMKNGNKRVTCRLEFPKAAQSAFVSRITAKIAANSKLAEPAAI